VARVGMRWTLTEFRRLIDSLPIRVFDRELPINKAGYYVAHILPVKPDRISGRLVSKVERIARFIRNVHPANHFYVPNRPKGIGRGYGEDRALIAFVADQYRERYARIWADFLRLANASDIDSLPGAFVDMAPCFGDPVTPIASASRVVVTKSHSLSETRVSTPYKRVLTGRSTGCCAPLSESDLRKGFRRWVGNDQPDRLRHQVVAVSESLDLKLAWRSSKDTPSTVVGCYRLNPRSLLSMGFVRLDKLNEPGNIRLQFSHESNGGIYIRVREDGPRLWVGDFGGPALSARPRVAQK
jgi:hypothetical protein